MLSLEGRKIGSEVKHFLSKKIVFDAAFNLDRICWVLEMFCPVCDQPLEVVFDDHPTEIEIMEAEMIPCDDCLALGEKDEVMDAVIKELFERDLPDHKS
jgi:hypothetical protein